MPTKQGMLGCQHSHTLSAAPPTKEFFLPCVRVWACVLAGSHLSAYACVRTRLLGRATATASGTRTQAAFGPAPWLKSLSVLLCAARRYHTLGRHTPGRPPPSSFAAAPPCVFRYLRGEHSTPPQTSPPRTRSGPTVDQETEDRKGLPQFIAGITRTAGTRATGSRTAACQRSRRRCTCRSHTDQRVRRGRHPRAPPCAADSRPKRRRSLKKQETKFPTFQKRQCGKMALGVVQQRQWAVATRPDAHRDRPSG